MTMDRDRKIENVRQADRFLIELPNANSVAYSMTI